MNGQEWSLPKDFFDKNKSESNLPTAGELSFFQMQILVESDLHDKITEYASASFDQSRINSMDEERTAVEALSTPEELVRFMKKKIEISNRDYLCRKAIQMGDDTAALIVEKLQTNGLDRFIECAMLILSRADDKYIDQVAEGFRQFRNGYARTQAAVLLAYRDRTDALKSIYDEYMQMVRSNDPDDRRNADSIRFAIHVLAEKDRKGT